MDCERQPICWIDLLPGVAVGVIAAVRLSPEALAGHDLCPLCWCVIGALQALMLGPAWALGARRRLGPDVAALLSCGKLASAALALALLHLCGAAERCAAAAGLLALAAAPPFAFAIGRRRVAPPLPAGAP